MNPLLAVAYALNNMFSTSRERRKDKRLTICASCETENEREANCCKSCGQDYLIPRGEFRAMKEDASKRRNQRWTARNTLSNLRRIRQCPSCEREFPGDHAHCTRCGLPCCPLNEQQVFRRMKKLHGNFIQDFDDMRLLEAPPPSATKGLLESLRDWWKSP